MSNEQQMGCVRRGGFTLVELLIASGISVLILAVTISVSLTVCARGTGSNCAWMRIRM
jgi:prepilin-type N-terminal cleavage/methylation domain-containing protein